MIPSGDCGGGFFPPGLACVIPEFLIDRLNPADGRERSRAISRRGAAGSMVGKYICCLIACNSHVARGLFEPDVMVHHSCMTLEESLLRGGWCNLLKPPDGGGDVKSQIGAEGSFASVQSSPLQVPTAAASASKTCDCERGFRVCQIGGIPWVSTASVLSSVHMPTVVGIYHCAAGCMSAWFLMADLPSLCAIEQGGKDTG